MSATIEYIEDVEQANFLLNKCLNTIDDLKNRVDEQKVRTQKYRETNTKLRKSNIDLRDYFAAKAMQVILAEELRTYKALEFTDNGHEIPSTDLKWIGHRAYYMADAMIEVRND
jgi:hypothetical protein